MNRIILLSAVFLLLGVSAFGQQDSLIVGSVTVDSGATAAFIPIYGVVFDSIYDYSMTLGIRAEEQDAFLGTTVHYFPPLVSWDMRYDSLMQNPQRIFMMGTSFYHDPIFTNGRRLYFWVLRIGIDPLSPPQVAVIDTFGQFSFGLNSVFQPGFVYIGMADGIGADGDLPGPISLSQNYPNPFNSSTLISFSAANDGYLTLDIYDLLGRKIRTLLENNITGGEYNILWNGKDDRGNDAVSGIYFYRITTTNRAEYKKMLLIR